MKWILGTAIIVAAVSSAVGAQSSKEMDKPAMDEKMGEMMNETRNATYTGCLESVNHNGRFLLTHVQDGGKKAMKDMSTEGMMPSALVLTGSPDLGKHANQKVTVTGRLSKGVMDSMRSELDTLTVGSLKVVSKSCS